MSLAEQQYGLILSILLCPFTECDMYSYRSQKHQMMSRSNVTVCFEYVDRWRSTPEDAFNWTLGDRFERGSNNAIRKVLPSENVDKHAVVWCVWRYGKILKIENTRIRGTASVLCIVYVDIVEASEHKKSIYGASIPDSMVGWRRSEMLSMTIFLLVVVIIPFVFSCCVSIGMHCCDREIECCLMLLPLLSLPIACLFWIYIAESHCWI